MSEDMKSNVHTHMERIPSESSKNDLAKVNTIGTVKLTDGDIVYIPAPTSDPQDPLNMPAWQKLVVTVIVSIFSTLGLSLVSGFGGLLGFYIPTYAAAGKTYADITALMTYPSLFMGIGNLIGMPLAVAVGRRSVMLGSTIILVVSAILCSTAKNYEWHLAARSVLGLAAGQSEALVPLIVQEIYFLHERSKGLMVQQTIQVILTAIWVLFASPIAGKITPQWWYGLGAALAAVQLIATFFLLPETKYARPLEAFQEVQPDAEGGDIESDPARLSSRANICTQRPALDFVTYAPRTLKSDMRMWVGKPEWKLIYKVLKETFTVMLFPNVFWAMCLNGLTLGANVAIGITYGTVITSAPYNWSQSSTSYVNCGQIVTALLALPLLGYGSDLLIKWKANRNGGIHEPENRLLPLFFPIIIGIFTAILYGQGAAHPERYHWFNVVWAVAAYYFTFVGANITAITYLLDSYPARSGSLLVVICAFRGIISFGVIYGIAPFVHTAGYDGMFNTFGGLTAALGLLAIPIYFFGKRIRGFTARWAMDSSRSE
ncbi:hypothetical protein H2198_004007 [Neophaeococcomyces mojaviensis]|uniref:Uncharacterized protein n=1 Tax=Neophaeococcomyces mojaviensis TaxID=3383035 RepID=A0ACC3A9R8_9EURO|nr:hypothetical protein H2198_004007 [Knufia sp. JES_112]